MYEQLSRGFRGLNFGLSLHLHSYFVCTSSKGYGETAWMHGPIFAAYPCNNTKIPRTIFFAKTSVSIGLDIKYCSFMLCFHQINTFLPNKHKTIVKKQFFGVTFSKIGSLTMCTGAILIDLIFEL